MTTVDRILEGARGLLAAAPGSTMTEIAAAAGVGRATVFRHFEGRTQLIHALATRALDATDRACAEAVKGTTSSIEALEAVIRATLSTGSSYHFLASLTEAWSDPELQRRYAEQTTALVDLVEGARREGQVRPELPTAWVAAAIDGLLWAAAQSVARQEIGAAQAPDLAWQAVAGAVMVRGEES